MNASSGSEWVRLRPPRPANRNLRAGLGLASRTTTRRPASAICSAAIKPAGPAPTTMQGLDSRGSTCAMNSAFRGATQSHSMRSHRPDRLNEGEVRRRGMRPYCAAGRRRPLRPHFDWRSFKRQPAGVSLLRVDHFAGRRDRVAQQRYPSRDQTFSKLGQCGRRTRAPERLGAGPILSKTPRFRQGGDHAMMPL